MIREGAAVHATTFPQKRGYVRQEKAREVFGEANRKGR